MEYDRAENKKLRGMIETLRQELAEARRALNDCRSLRDALSDCNHQLSMDAISARKARISEMSIADKTGDNMESSWRLSSRSIACR